MFEESSDGWFRTGTLTLQGNVRILDASQDRVLFVHRDSLGQETVVVARRGS
ncbi:MAG: long-chain fatty acid--CoA ligase [Gemmatimonadetes bacterium]|nr:long-chain fatty acid--CoA ligase [Gemmatimonadota bacterium]MYA10293.1 long-chain fatty acid--CoA ligase [Gemmatimonadota bacterium]MYD12532.1 long-chain fatty acid--CoA ligase [Gemmatimonadota bacterium]MYE71368.1 long-chain fatty acid--CoA ligase [Gemmatimonadota bacterium]MYI65693.1 long-chain fatty acid--CoA ligase [Gemmatimonadota bacterium]